MVGILVLSGLGAVAGTESKEENIIFEKLVFSQPIICEKEDYVSIDLTEATTDSWETDKPMLPVVSKEYTFEFGTIVDNVEVSFSDIIEQKISKPIMVSPEPQIISTMYTSNEVNNQEKVVSYSDIDVYPEVRWGYRTGAGLKDKEHVIYLTVHLYPVQYNPKENIIYYSENVVIDITYTQPEEPVNFPDEYDFLILAPEDFESALQPLVNHKNGLGIETKLTTLDEIPSVGVDEQESIKYYIKDAIEEWGITDVLIVGAGVEGEEVFPVRQAWIDSLPHEEYFPSDLYYADIYNGTGGFSNWDVDGDGRYAEYSKDMANIDVHPDVYLGRFPCNDVSEVNTIVNKIINYKAHNKMTNKILQAGGDTFTDDAGGVYEGEYANTVVLGKLPGYSTTQLWGTNGKLTKWNIGKGYRSCVDFVDFSGHGSWASWATHPPKDEQNWVPDQTLISQWTGFAHLDVDLYRLTNAKKLPVVFYNACSNNKYTESRKCLGWKTLSKNGGGGIATFAASGIGFGSHGTAETERVFGWMEVHTFEELYNTKVLGQVWANCVSGYYNTFESELDKNDWKTLLEYSMFGDPTLVIEDGDDPVNIPQNIPDLNILEFLLDHFPRLAILLELILARLS